MSGGAFFSPCRRYRWRLWREWGDATRRCVFVGLNPSDADEHDDDPTVRKCRGFSTRWGFGRLDIVNLFGLVSTTPLRLLSVADPVGEENDYHVAQALRGTIHRPGSRIVWAWGRHHPEVRALIKHRLEVARLLWTWPLCEVGTLGANADGSPCHPARIAYATPFRPAHRPFDFDPERQPR